MHLGLKLRGGVGGSIGKGREGRIGGKGGKGRKSGVVHS